MSLAEALHSVNGARHLHSAPTERMSRATALLGRATGVARTPWALPFGGYSLVLDAAASVEFEAASMLEISFGETRLCAALSQEAHDALAAGAHIAPESVMRDPQIAALAAEATLEPLLDRVDAAIGEKSVILDWSVQRPMKRLEWRSALVLRDREVCAKLALGVDERDAATAAQWLALAPTAAINEHGISLKARLTFPTILIGVDEARLLKPGDYILNDLAWSNLRLSVGGQTWRCRMNDDASILADSAFQQSQPASLEGSDVEITIEVARVNLPLSEARAIIPGHVTPLGRRVGSEVELYVGDRRFARGRLVDIEGEMGVEITELN